jgi:hypothetical protein
MISARAIAEARKEILTSSSQAIEIATSTKWAARALAAYELSLEEDDLFRFAQACDFHHEAVEHAAGASPTFLASIAGILLGAQQQTIAAFEGSATPEEQE